MLGDARGRAVKEVRETKEHPRCNVSKDTKECSGRSLRTCET